MTILQERRSQRERKAADEADKLALDKAVQTMRGTIGMALGTERIPRPIEAAVAQRGWTYLIQANCGAIKIGRARNVGYRLTELQCANPRELTLLAVMVDGGREVELHRRFAEHRLRGEWFAPHPDILAVVEQANEPLVTD